VTRWGLSPFDIVWRDAVRGAALSSGRPVLWRFGDRAWERGPAPAAVDIVVWENGRLQQIAANRLTIPQDIAAILLQGFVRHS
jgi:hypothetical protein